MILGIIDKPVIGVYDALRPARGGMQRVDIALMVLPPGRVRQEPFVVSEPVAADAFAVGVIVQPAAVPAERAGIFLDDEVLRQMSVEMQIERHVLRRGILPALVERGRGACFAAFYTLQPRTIIKKWRSTLIIGWGMLIGGILMSFYQKPWEFNGIWDLDTALTLSAIIIFGTAIAFCAYLESTKYLSPTKISVFASLEPFSSIILSIIFLNISFGLFELIGAIIIILAVTILSK